MGLVIENNVIWQIVWTVDPTDEIMKVSWWKEKLLKIWMKLALYKVVNKVVTQREIVKVTSITWNIIWIERNVEGCPLNDNSIEESQVALEFHSWDFFSNNLTAGDLKDLQNDSLANGQYIDKIKSWEIELSWGDILEVQKSDNTLAKIKSSEILLNWNSKNTAWWIIELDWDGNVPSDNLPTQNAETEKLLIKDMIPAETHWQVWGKDPIYLYRKWIEWEDEDKIYKTTNVGQAIWLYSWTTTAGTPINLIRDWSIYEHYEDILDNTEYYINDSGIIEYLNYPDTISIRYSNKTLLWTYNGSWVVDIIVEAEIQSYSQHPKIQIEQNWNVVWYIINTDNADSFVNITATISWVNLSNWELVFYIVGSWSSNMRWAKNIKIYSNDTTPLTTEAKNNILIWKSISNRKIFLYIWWSETIQLNWKVDSISVSWDSGNIIKYSSSIFLSINSIGALGGSRSWYSNNQSTRVYEVSDDNVNWSKLYEHTTTSNSWSFSQNYWLKWWKYYRCWTTTPWYSWTAKIQYSY